MMLKYLKYKIRIWAIMLKNFRISSPNGGLDSHLAQGCWEGYVDKFPYNQSSGRAPIRQLAIQSFWQELRKGGTPS
jgi:hypothetical protein